MKKISFLMSSIIMALSITILSFNTAKAEECSVSNPCDNWASVDANGVVTNVIVCQMSVCGQDGSWGGIDPNNGNRLVPQTSGNRATGDVQGTSGYIGDPSRGSVVIENNGVFTIIEGETKTVVQDGVELTTVVPETKRSFTFNSSIGKLYNEIEMQAVSPEQNTTATISAKRQTSTNLILETKTFLERKTADEVIDEVSLDGLSLILSKVEIFLNMLGAWVKP